MGKTRERVKYIAKYGFKGIKKALVTKSGIKNGTMSFYDAWIYNNEPSNYELKKQAKSAQNVAFEIVCKKNKKVLDSINSQTYKKYVVTDIEKQNICDIVENTKSDYIVLVDDNIELQPFALFELAKEIKKQDANLIYSDNDKLKERKRVNPHFKPDFAKDTIISQNYIGNFIAIKTKLLKENKEILEDLNKEYIYDLILRVSEKTSSISHISKILFHELEEKIDVENEKKIIAEHLDRQKMEYTSIEDGKFKGQYKVNYVINGNPKISIVVPNKDHIEDLDKLLKSTEKSTYSNYEFIIVENNSENKETFEYYEKITKKDSRIKVVKFEINYFNYSSIVNFGVQNSMGEYIVLLNNDIEFISADWIEQMLMYAQRTDVGICGVKLYFPDRSIQHAGVTIGTRGLAGHRNREMTEEEYHLHDYINIVQDLSAVTAACFMVRKQLYLDLKGFDEKLAVAFNDVDFCLKARQQNYLVVYNPFVEAYHYESKSRGEDTMTEEKQERFKKEFETFVERWGKTIEIGDPYYNKNYKLDTDLPEINYNKII